jgi:hypothetical protein
MDISANFFFHSSPQMQFIWGQVANYLYAADIFSLRIVHHLAYTHIPIKKVYDCANRVVSQLNNKQEHFGTDYHGYFVRSRIFLLECLTGLNFERGEGFYNDYDFIGDIMHCLVNLNYLLHETPAPSFDFLKICLYDKQVYVANWNSIIERKCIVQQLENEKNFGCAKSVLRELQPKKRLFQRHGFQIKMLKFQYCYSCSRGDLKYCTDLILEIDDQRSVFEYYEEEKYEEEKYEEEDEDEDVFYSFYRLAKRQSLIKQRDKKIKKKKYTIYQKKTY